MAGLSFGVELDGVLIGQIYEVSGLSVPDPIEVKQTTSDGKVVIKKLPGRPVPGEVTVSRLRTDDGAFARWLEHGRSAAVVVFDADGKMTRRYTLVAPIPKRLETVPSPSDDTLTEKLVIAYENVEVE